jgi:hypothetical protein
VREGETGVTGADGEFEGSSLSELKRTVKREATDPVEKRGGICGTASDGGGIGK